MKQTIFIMLLILGISAWSQSNNNSNLPPWGHEGPPIAGDIWTECGEWYVESHSTNDNGGFVSKICRLCIKYSVEKDENGTLHYWEEPEYEQCQDDPIVNPPGF